MVPRFVVMHAVPDVDDRRFLRTLESLERRLNRSGMRAAHTFYNVEENVAFTVVDGADGDEIEQAFLDAGVSPRRTIPVRHVYTDLLAPPRT